MSQKNKPEFKKSSPPSSKKKIIIGVSVLVVALAAAGTGSFLYFHESVPVLPDINKTDSKDIATFLASKDFAKVPVDKKLEYMDSLRAKNEKEGKNPFDSFRELPKEQRDKIMGNMRPVFEERMKQEAKKYCSLKTQAEKDAYLDERIDRMEKMRKDREERRKNENASSGQNASSNQNQGQNQGQGQNQNQRQGRGFSTDRMKGMIENSDPETRAVMAQMRLDMRARMEQRQAAAASSSSGK